MKNHWKVLSLAVGVVLLLGVLGAGAVLAQDPPTPTDFHAAFLSRVAQILGVPEQSVIDAVNQAHTETLDQAVADGLITQEQADWMKQHQQAGGGIGPGGFAGGPMHGGARSGPMFGGPFGGPWGAAPSATQTQ